MQHLRCRCNLYFHAGEKKPAGAGWGVTAGFGIHHPIGLLQAAAERARAGLEPGHVNDDRVVQSGLGDGRIRTAPHDQSFVIQVAF